MKQLLKYLNLPDVMKMNDGTPVTAENWAARRDEILELLQTELYGKLPPEPTKIEETGREVVEEDALTVTERADLRLTYENGVYSYPVYLTLPKGVENPAIVITIGISRDIPAMMRRANAIPELVYRHGYGVATIYCADIASDSNSFEDGLPTVLFPEGRKDGDAGKLMIWGRCMSYVRTYLEQRGGFDLPNTVMAGCSRFGKTALAGGLYDPRIRHVVSVCSGTGGTAILRGKVGETVDSIVHYAPYWFCAKFLTYDERTDELPFDAHFIVAAFAGRNLLLTGAIEDYWCDPYFEMLAAIAGSPLHEAAGQPGFIYDGPHPVPGYRYPIPGDFFQEGNIGFTLRLGGHGFPAADWQRIVEFVDRRRG